jgi:hypothetical protein
MSVGLRMATPATYTAPVFPPPTKTNIVGDGNSIMHAANSGGYTVITPVQMVAIQSTQTGWGSVSNSYVDISVSGQTIDDMITRAPTFLQPAFDSTSGMQNILLVYELTNQIGVELSALAASAWTQAQIATAAANAVAKLWTYCGMARGYGFGGSTGKIIVNTLINRTSAADLSVTAATNASPIVVTTASAHGRSPGDTVIISDCAGNTAANGTWVLSAASGSSMTLTGSTGNGAYSGGGYYRAFWECAQIANALVLANYASHCDGVADCGADSFIGGVSGRLNTNYMQSDGTHPFYEGECLIASAYMDALDAAYSVAWHPMHGPGVQYGWDLAQPISDFKDTAASPATVVDLGYVGKVLGYGIQSGGRTVYATSPDAGAGTTTHSWQYNATGLNGKPSLFSSDGARKITTPNLTRGVYFECVFGSIGATAGYLSQFDSGYGYFYAANGDSAYASDGTFASAIDVTSGQPWINDGLRTYMRQYGGTHATHQIWRSNVLQATTTITGNNPSPADTTRTWMLGGTASGSVMNAKLALVASCEWSSARRTKLETYCAGIA